MTPRTQLATVGGVVAAAAAALVLVVQGPAPASPAAAGSTTTAPSPTATTGAPSSTTTAVPTTTVPPTTTPPSTVAPDDGTLRTGARGPAVLDLQTKLSGLGYWLGTPDGTYGTTTQQAVLAFQKANGLGRDGSAGPTTLATLATAGRPVPSSTVDGLEIDLARQLITLVRGGQALWVLNTSTGKPGMDTPPGDFVVQREIDGMRHAPLGDLFRPKYFNGGIAVHGSPSIPGYPASHGCARVSNAAIDFLWSSGLLPVGSPVRVH
jgi:peptidoglycan hydrolase-like protein with peptidoglycan-binding domain